jgi:hypothetical protein
VRQAQAVYQGHENKDPHPMGKERFDTLTDAMVREKAPAVPSLKQAPKHKR